MNPTIKSATDQFVEDFLLVAENDYKMYLGLKADAEIYSVVGFSEALRNEYEQLIEQVSELVDEKISETAGLLIRQLLQGWGSAPFDQIARHLKENN